MISSENGIAVKREDGTRAIKRLIWLYFWLLIFEGALRKWIFPGQANALLIVRDPVLLLIYFEAIKRRVFPVNGFISATIIMAVLSFLTGILSAGSNIYVALYGIRTDFLHIPLIFIIAQVFSIDDVEDVGRWVLKIAIPMAALIALQFVSPKNHPINCAVTEGMVQLEAARGVIRPAGTFSFNTGTGHFVALASAFLLYGFFRQRLCGAFLMLCAAMALTASMLASGSRTMILSVAIVFFSATYVVISKPSLIKRSFKWVVISGSIIAFMIPLLGFIESGISVLEGRFVNSGGLKIGIIDRYVGEITAALDLAFHAPFFGYGIGVGTNAGAALLVGKREFLLAESELSRIIMESGFFIGPAFIFLRAALVLYLLLKSLAALKNNNVLPILLFSVCALNIFNGQWSQPTNLGFAVFGAGLCLAACNEERYKETRS